MKIFRYAIVIFAVIGFISLVLLILATVMDAQTLATPAVVVKAHIPYDFWIDARRLPAGDYTLSHMEDTIVLFRNRQDKAVKQAFLLPTGHQVAIGDHKLVFIVHNGQHYLREIWDGRGRQVITSQSYLSLADGDTETQVRLVERKRHSSTPQSASDQ